MAELAPKIQRTYRQRDSVKPSSAAIRQLFGRPDGNETRKMLDEICQLEKQRLEAIWHFDVRQHCPAGQSSVAAGEKNSNFPIPKMGRYVWEKQDPATVPSFYTRTYHSHHSDPRLLQENLHEMSVKERKLRKSPQPLSTLNANQIPPINSPRPSIISSPVKLSSERQDSTLVKQVPAIKYRLLNQSHGESCKNATVKVEERIREEIPPESQSLFAMSETVSTSKTSASRKLFQKEKLPDPKKAARQLKITDLIPMKRPRLISSKQARHQPKDTTITAL